MRLCFHHQPFDTDVSSGTQHAISQWSELCMAMGVTDVAVINETDDDITGFSDDIKLSIYNNLDEFLSNTTEDILYVEQGGSNYRNIELPNDSWYVFGGASGLPKADIGIPTGVALYPREAAAIILSEAAWR